jgi:hypothetical protein
MCALSCESQSKVRYTLAMEGTYYHPYTASNHCSAAGQICPGSFAWVSNTFTSMIIPFFLASLSLLACKDTVWDNKSPREKAHWNYRISALLTMGNLSIFIDEQTEIQLIFTSCSELTLVMIQR